MRSWHVFARAPYQSISSVTLSLLSGPASAAVRAAPARRKDYRNGISGLREGSAVRLFASRRAGQCCSLRSRCFRPELSAPGRNRGRGLAAAFERRRPGHPDRHRQQSRRVWKTRRKVGAVQPACTGNVLGARDANGQLPWAYSATVGLREPGPSMLVSSGGAALRTRGEMQVLAKQLPPGLL